MLLVTLVVGAQYSFWGNYLPRVFPLHLRGTGESFAMSFGGRVLAPLAALATTQLSNVMPGADADAKLATSMALVAVAATVLRVVSLEPLAARTAARTPGGLIMSAASTYLLDNASAKAGTPHGGAGAPVRRRPRGGCWTSTGLARRLALPRGGRWRWQRGALDGGTRRARRARVLCTDLDTRIIERARAAAGATCEVERHDIAQDPLPASALRSRRMRGWC